MFKTPDEFAYVVLERKMKYPEYSLIEIMIILQDEYGIEEKDLLKLIGTSLKSRIEGEAIKSNMIKRNSKSLV